MKWIFLVGLIFFTPVLIMLLRSNRDHLPKAAVVLGLLPFIETRFNVSAAPISWALWPGYVKGIEFSLTDAVALALLGVFVPQVGERRSVAPSISSNGTR